MSSSSDRAGLRGQLSAAGIVIGCVGCVIITASSVYTALKMGSLPWPTIFTSITALVLLRAVGRTSLNEANITQVIMSAGSMVAGGLAFTIPGVWMLGLADKVSWGEMLAVALAGTLLGLVCTALIQRHFVEESDLEYPIGTAAAETLLASRAGGSTGTKLFGSRAVAGGSALGLWDVATAQGIVSSLGMGLMMGSGAGVVVRDIVVPLVRGAQRGAGAKRSPGDGFISRFISRYDAGVLALMAAAAALIVCFALGLSPVVAMAVVLLSFVTAIMSAQSVGQSGIDPMEIFGLIVLLFVAAFSEASEVQLFFVAGVIAVACGLAGDVMSDFKTGQIIGTSPRSMWFGQAIGAVLGTFVAVAVMVALVTAYGPDAFGTDAMFVSAQANVVATMVSGIPSVPAFVVGLVGGAALYIAGIPSMMLGLGVYLPFYMSISTVLGAVVRWVYDRVSSARGADEESAEETGVVVASGILGGESIVGVIVAFATVAAGLMG